MKQKTADDPHELLAPLLDVLRGHRCLRLLARPGHVVVDRVDGSAVAEVAWESAPHEAAVAALGAGHRFEDGCTARALGDRLLLWRPPDPLRRADDLAHDGRLSSLASRMLTAAVGAGRNVLVTGPWCASVELIAALLADGERPVVAGGADVASPGIWPRVTGLAEVRALGADRVGLWDGRLDATVDTLAGSGGVVAWIDAGRLDRALMRFELAAAAAVGSATSPLQVLAAVDLVVVLSAAVTPRVREVAEIVLTDEGYRPSLLFASGLPPVPTALVPVGLPSFVDELARAGHTVLVDELQHAVGAPTAAVSAPAFAPAAAPAPAEPAVEPAAAPRPVVETSLGGPPEPRFDASLEDAPPPGWELDQIGDEGLDDGAVGAGSPEAAALAATFGLGPPPAPEGVAPMVPDLPASAPETGAFEEAMRRARARDAEMQAEDADEVEREEP